MEAHAKCSMLTHQGCLVGLGVENGKTCLRRNGRSNAVEHVFSGNVEHLTLMPVLFADLKLRPPVVILPYALHKVRVRENEEKEMIHDFNLPRCIWPTALPQAWTKEFFCSGWRNSFFKLKIFVANSSILS